MLRIGEQLRENLPGSSQNFFVLGLLHVSRGSDDDGLLGGKQSRRP
jgi:hypothetical protein